MEETGVKAEGADIEEDRQAIQRQLKKLELEIKKKELETKSKDDKLSKLFGLSPLVTAIIAGTISIAGGIIANAYQSKNNLALERYKFDSNRQLEQKKQTHELVLKMIGTGDATQAAKNL